MTLPPFPTWEGLHALVVHFPLALLFVAPLFVLLSIMVRNSGKWLQLSALILMALGTAGIYLAIATGESDGERAEKIANVKPVLEEHEELAETTRMIFTGLTIVFAGITFSPAIVRRTLAYRTRAVVNLLFLVLYAGGAVWLANTGHQGARLVHELGVHAPFPQNASLQPGKEQTRPREEQIENDEH